MSIENANNFCAPSEWTFKAPDVAAAFDRHVREQLPWYDLATGVVVHAARHWLPQGGTVVDVGAATGNIGRALAHVLDARKARFIAIDDSEDMARAYQGPGQLQVVDARAFDFAGAQPDLIIAFLVLMFVPVADRADLIRRMVASLRPGGAVVVFDKMSPVAGHVGTVIYRLTLAAKYEAGALPDEIIRKELSLAGSQRPMVEAELDGFTPLFRFGDFAGFVHERAAT
jgi:tRNA (cmo5U34)-methyltransferase